MDNAGWARGRVIALLAVAVIVALAACDGSGSSPSPAAQGGIAGVASAGPVCPVERPGDPACAPRPVAGAVIVIRDALGNEVATATTAADGRYAVRLPPGRYSIEGLPVDGLMGNPERVDVEVREGIAIVDLPYDTGIR